MKKFFFIFILLFNCLFLFSQDDYVADGKIENKTSKHKGVSNPDFTNYTLTASAYTLNKRDFRFSNTDIIFTKASYGLRDNTTVSVNTSLAGTFVGAIKQNININDGIDLALSASAGQALFVPEDSVVNIVGGQALITLGDHQNNFTIGTGFYYAKSNYDVIDNNREFYLQNIFVATQRQIRPKTYIVAEGIYFFNYNTFVGSLALKFIIKTRMSLLVGIMPLYRNGRITPNRSTIEGGVVPVASFRFYLDRH